VTQALPLLISAVVERSDRVRAAVEAHFDAIWRFSRRMGVAERDAEDAAQQVFLVFSQKVDTVTTGAERAFLFATALRVAADCRKKSNRAREVMLEGEAQPVDDAHAEPGAERALAEAAARRAQTDRHPANRPTEIAGRDGPEPTRYGDWEINGLTSDF